MLNTIHGSGSRGFSLIELMIAIAVIATLTMLALPNYKIMTENTKIRTTTESIQNGLQLARAEAIARNAQIRFQLGAGADWSIGCVNVTATCPNVIQRRLTAEGSAAELTVTPTPPGATNIVFNSFGSVVAAADTLTRVDIDSTVLTASQSKELRVVIGIGGTVRACDPNTSPPDVRAC